ncbi:MAG: TIGR02266 family protein [Deltaproteobacteria bacterium]|nr:TIGR02266 family protein [Deltaproteobacteria bacterium]
MNPRRADRLQLELLVGWRAGEVHHTDPATNISRGGLFLNTAQPQGVGTVLRLVVSLPDSAQPIELAGKVVRVVPVGGPPGSSPGMAVEFTGTDVAQQERLEHFVQRLRAALEDEPAEGGPRP